MMYSFVDDSRIYDINYEISTKNFNKLSWKCYLLYMNILLKYDLFIFYLVHLKYVFKWIQPPIKSGWTDSANTEMIEVTLLSSA